MKKTKIFLFFVVLIFLPVLSACVASYTLTTDDAKAIVLTQSPIRVSSITIRNNTPYTVIIDSYPVSIQMSPASELRSGGIMKLSYNTWLRNDYGYNNVTIIATAKGFVDGRPVRGDKRNWSFSENYYYGSRDYAWIIESSRDGRSIYFR